jgi:hypothetical protein
MPAPVLTRAERANSRSVYVCGAFTYIDDWALTNRVQGVIIQKVTRSLTDLVMVNGGLELPLSLDQAKTAFDPQNDTLFLDVLTYWELFDVPAGTGVIDGDQFQSNWFAKTGPESKPNAKDGQPIATTRGKYQISGEARFYPTTKTPTQLGFPGKLKIAAKLPSTTTDPTPNLAGLVPSASVTRTVAATWDSAKLDTYKDVHGKDVSARGVTQLAIL